MQKQEQLVLRTSHGEIPVHRFAPATPGPLLAIIPSIYGVTPDVVHFARRFAADGALVYAIDPFWRSEPGPLHIPDDTQKALRRKQITTLADVTYDLVVALDTGLQDSECNGYALALGICFGGKPAVHAATHRHLHGIAVWHGAGLLSVLNNDSLRDTQISFDFGESDPLIPMSEVDAIAKCLPQHSTHIRTHPNAGHGFSHIGTVKYDDAAATRAQRGVSDLIRTFSSN